MLVDAVALTVMSIATFYFVNWLGSQAATGYGYAQISLVEQDTTDPAFNDIFRIVSPVVVSVVFAALAVSIGWISVAKIAWLATPGSFFFRALFAVSWERVALVNGRRFTGVALASTALAYVVAELVLTTPEKLIPSADSLATEVWLLVSLFLYSTFNQVRFSNQDSQQRKERYVQSRIRSIETEFGAVIEEELHTPALRAAAKAILLVETYNRPAPIRALERLLVRFGPRTIGPMQVRAERWISDLESVRMGCKILQTNHTRALEAGTQGNETWRGYARTPVFEAIASYNRDDNYVASVISVLGYIEPQWYNEGQSASRAFDRYALNTHLQVGRLIGLVRALGYDFESILRAAKQQKKYRRVR